MKAHRWPLLLLLALFSSAAFAADVTLQWDANTEPDLAGYNLYYGVASGIYTTKIPLGKVTSHTVTGLAEDQTYYFVATARDGLDNESGHSNEVVYAKPGGTETISAPLPPSGPTSVAAGETHTYTAGGAVSSTGDAVQYRFSWADGSLSDWLPAGTLTATKSWAAAGVYAEVRVEARCAQHPSAVSPASPPLSVTVGPAGAETVSRPWVPSSAAGAAPGTMVYTTGGAFSSTGDPLQYRFLWSDGSVSEWLPVGVIEAAKTWSAAGSYTVRAEARCAHHTTVVSDPGDPLAVNVALTSGETLSTPAPPVSPGNVRPAWQYVFQTWGAVSSAGDLVQYRLLWGDGTASEWSPALSGGAVIQAWKSWPAEGIYAVTAEARCALHPEVTAASAAVNISVGLGATRLFYDTFSDGTAFGDPQWRVVAGKWSGRAKVLTSASRKSGNWAIVDTLPELTTARLATKIKLTTAATKRGAGVIYAFKDAAHYRYAEIRNSRLQLGQVGATEAEPAGVKAAKRIRIRPGVWQNLRLDIHPDGEARVFLGSSKRPVLSYRFAEPIAGQVGVTANGSVANFDNFGVWDERVLPP